MAKIDLQIGDEAVIPSRILEISNDPTDEVCVMTPNIFEPKEVKVSGASYTLPAAAVAIVEFDVK